MKKLYLVFIILLLVTSLSLSVSNNSDTNRKSYIVVLREPEQVQKSGFTTLSQKDFVQTLESRDVEVKTQFKIINAVHVYLTDDEFAALSKDSNVLRIEEDKKIQLFSVKVFLKESIPAIGVDELNDTLYPSHLDGSGVNITVIDTGHSNSSLWKDRIIAEKDFTRSAGTSFNFVTGYNYTFYLNITNDTLSNVSLWITDEPFYDSNSGLWTNITSLNVTVSQGGLLIKNISLNNSWSPYEVELGDLVLGQYTVYINGTECKEGGDYGFCYSNFKLFSNGSYVDSPNPAWVDSILDTFSLHSSMILSIIGGNTSHLANKDLSRDGLAPKANLVVAKVFDDVNGTKSDDPASSVEIIEAIEWAVDKGVDILSLSLGVFGSESCNGSTAMSLAVDNATNSGVIVIVAVGNKDGVGIPDPACSKSGLTVGWSNKDGTLNPSSSMGFTGDGRYKPEMVAPGTSVMSFVIDYNSTHSGILDPVPSGSSFSTPHVVGVAALLLQAKPTLNPHELKTLLMATATYTGETGTGMGVVNAYHAYLNINNTRFEELDDTVNITKYHKVQVDNTTNFTSVLYWPELSSVHYNFNMRIFDPSGYKIFEGNNTTTDVYQYNISSNPSQGEYIIEINATNIIGAQNYTLATTYNLSDGIIDVLTPNVTITTKESVVNVNGSINITATVEDDVGVRYGLLEVEGESENITMTKFENTLYTVYSNTNDNTTKNYTIHVFDFSGKYNNTTSSLRIEYLPEIVNIKLNGSSVWPGVKNNDTYSSLNYTNLEFSLSANSTNTTLCWDNKTEQGFDRSPSCVQANYSGNNSDYFNWNMTDLDIGYYWFMLSTNSTTGDEVNSSWFVIESSYLPDLKPTGIYNNSALINGTDVLVGVEVSNLGGVDAKDVNVSVRINSSLVHYDIINISAKSYEFTNFTHTFYSTKTYVINVTVDPFNEIIESNKTNNEYIHQFEFPTSPPYFEWSGDMSADYAYNSIKYYKGQTIANLSILAKDYDSYVEDVLFRISTSGTSPTYYFLNGTVNSVGTWTLMTNTTVNKFESGSLDTTSNLKDKLLYFYFKANDTYGNENTTSYKLYFDNEKPDSDWDGSWSGSSDSNILVECCSYDSGSGIKEVRITVVGSDIKTCTVNSNQPRETSLCCKHTHNEYVTSTTTRTVKCRAIDNVGNTESEISGTITVNPTTTDGQDGDITPPTYDAEKTFSTMTTSSQGVWDISVSGIPLTKIQIFVSETLTGFKLGINKRTSFAWGAPPGIIYSYVDLHPLGATSSISEVEFTFKVPKTWFNTYDINVSSITLYRYASAQWNALETELSSEDSANYYFVAESPGLSTFSITGVKNEDNDGDVNDENDLGINITGMSSLNETFLPDYDKDNSENTLIYIAVTIIAVAVGATLFILKKEEIF